MVVLMLSLAVLASEPSISSRTDDGRIQVVVLSEANGHPQRQKLDVALHDALPDWVVPVPLSTEQETQLASGQGCRALAQCVAHYVPASVEWVIDPALTQTASGTVLTLIVRKKGKGIRRASLFVTETTLEPLAKSIIADIFRSSSPELRLMLKVQEGDAAAAQKLLAEFPDSPWLEELSDASGTP